MKSHKNSRPTPPGTKTKIQIIILLLIATALLLAACSQEVSPAAPSPSELDEVTPQAAYVCPVTGGTYGYTWGAPRPGGTHKGADIFAPRPPARGTPLLAVTNGKIEYTRTNGSGDNRLKLAGADGKWYYYGHLDRFVSGMREGQSITKGQVIGYMGSENQGSGAVHLHFEIHPTRVADDNERDPHPFLDIWCKGGPAPVPTSVTWTGVGVGDVDGDKTADIVWQNSEGKPHYWTMKAGKRKNGKNIRNNRNKTWKIVGVGDVDGDKIDDLIWHNTKSGRTLYWKMKKGGKYGGYKDIRLQKDKNWRAVGVGDMNGDGTDDIVWRNRKTGRTNYWIMKKGKHTGHAYIDPDNYDSAWKVVGIGDVDGDKTDDIIWQRNDGMTHYWKIKKGKRVDYANIYRVSSGWRVIGVGDVDGDKTDDIVWRHSDSGQTHYWKMKKGKRVDYANIYKPFK